MLPADYQKGAHWTTGLTTPGRLPGCLRRSPTSDREPIPDGSEAALAGYLLAFLRLPFDSWRGTATIEFLTGAT